MTIRNPLVAVVLLAAVICAACVRMPVGSEGWPVDLPPVAHFERIYENDPANQKIQTRESYLRWVIRFYEGWDLYQDGWKPISRDILLGIDNVDEKQRLSDKLKRLGKRIAGEWAKDTRDRAIRSRQLSVWGQALLESINRDEEEKLVNRVRRDVDALLEGDLDPAEITLERYYADSERAVPAKDS